MEKTWMPIVGGILSIIAGALGLLGGLLATVVLSVYTYSSYFSNGTANLPGAAIWIFFTPYFIICILAIVGGIFSVRRRIWGLALAGAIAALLTFWLWPLGVAAIVLVSISKHEFDHGVSTPQPPAINPPSPPPPPATTGQG